MNTCDNYDAIVRPLVRDDQWSWLSGIPTRLPGLSDAALLLFAESYRLDVLAQQTRLAALIDHADDGRSATMMTEIMVREFAARRICAMCADELERRRTGVAPRARKMN